MKVLHKRTNHMVELSLQEKNYSMLVQNISVGEIQKLLIETLLAYIDQKTSFPEVLAFNKAIRKRDVSTLSAEIVGASAMLNFLDEQLSAGEISNKNTHYIQEVITTVLQDLVSSPVQS